MKMIFCGIMNIQVVSIGEGFFRSFFAVALGTSHFSDGAASFSVISSTIPPLFFAMTGTLIFVFLLCCGGVVWGQTGWLNRDNRTLKAAGDAPNGKVLTACMLVEAGSYDFGVIYDYEYVTDGDLVKFFVTC